MLRYMYRKLVSSATRRHRYQRRALRRAYRALSAFPRHASAPKHSLDAPLIISLTSYPRRFPTLHLTIKSLLDQTVKPDTVILWIAHEHIGLIPQDVLALDRYGLVVNYCEDILSFKKIIPALEMYPDAFIVTVDDDMFYPNDWLERLLAAYDPAEPTVICNRAHRIRYDEKGKLAPYRNWEWNVHDQATTVASKDLLPTGNGGTMYPPGSLAPESTDKSLIRKLSPHSDDVWLYFMWRRAGWSIKRVPGPPFVMVEWPDTQSEALWLFHRGGKKDEHLAAMSDYFGVPRP